MDTQHTPVPVQTEPKRFGMDELSFFVQMVTFHLEREPLGTQGRFWKVIEKQCPQLLTAIRASFMGEYAHILFTRSISSATFSTEDDSIAESKPEERSQTSE